MPYNIMKQTTVTNYCERKSGKMGLAASQARLLTITARKSDCEFQSMRYSHQKIALSRSMTDISNEYQNSLNLTKLVYDYYGNGDTSTLLSYNLLMTPSQLNGFLPTLVTDGAGKAVLNKQYAAAARAAGIPQEGLGTLPSTEIRNRFLQGLADNGLITQEMAKTCKSIEYSQEMGLGVTDYATVSTSEISLDELLTKIDNAGFRLNIASDIEEMKANRDGDSNLKVAVDNGRITTASGNGVTLTELFKNDYTIYGSNYDKKGDDARFSQESLNISHLSTWEDLISAFDSVLNSGVEPQAGACEYAAQMTRNLVYFIGETYVDNDGNIVTGTTMNPSVDDSDPVSGWGNYETGYKKTQKRGKAESKSIENASKCIGYYGWDSRNSGGVFGWRDSQYDSVGISVSNIAKAYLTYYAEYLDGYNGDYSIENKEGISVGGGHSGHHALYNTKIGTSRTVWEEDLINKDSKYKFTVVESIDVNADQGLYSGFYDALFNQICTKGWVENDKVMETEYLQEMLQTGKFFLATCADDGYYYQGNYATNTFIKEVSDEEAIAKAEAKYNTEKQKINQKEEIIDLKMKNLDTEISSLTTEYDTVKSVISKNVEKSFKRYNA